MKHMKRLASIMLALVLVLGMATTAFAEETHAGTAEDPFVAENATPAPLKTTTVMYGADMTTGHTYEVYQIFAGDVDSSKSILSNAVWGTNAINNGVAVTPGEAVPQTVLDALAAVSDAAYDPDKIAVIEKYVDLTTTPVGSIQDGKYLTVPTGYYLIKDIGPVSDGEEYGLYVVQVIGETNISQKACNDIVSTKKVKDINDSTGEVMQTLPDPENPEEKIQAEWVDSADYDIGDLVPFRLEARVPSLFDDYAYGYKLVFHDTEEAGLTFNKGTVSVKWEYKDYVEEDGEYKLVTRAVEIPLEGQKPVLDANGQPKLDASGEPVYSIFQNYTIVENAEHSIENADGTTIIETHTFDIVFENLKELYDANGNPIQISGEDSITVEYSSTLNDRAKIGTAGNANRSYITYTNDMNDKTAADGGKTPVDTVRVFTYETVINKVEKDEYGQTVPLKGAEFTLEKFVIDEDTGTDTYTVGGVTYTGNWETHNAVKNEAGTTFTFSGLDDGWYRLTESTTPDGYNTIAPIYFTIEAEHDLDNADPQLLDVTAYKTSDDGWAKIQDKDDSGNPKVDADGNPVYVEFGAVVSGIVSDDILNVPGTLLPSTGGIGTTIFYMVGSVLLLGAVVMFITKKRMCAVKESE